LALQSLLPKLVLLILALGGRSQEAWNSLYASICSFKGDAFDALQRVVVVDGELQLLPLA
jgi:hypothetical protein